MITTKEALERFEKTATYYIHELNQFSLEQLQAKPSDNEWSMGQMIRHLINSALYMQLRNIEQCLASDQDQQGLQLEKTERGAAAFAQGSFPPIRIQVPPSPEYTPEQPETKEQLSQGLQTVIQRMKDIEPDLEQASKLNTIAHPSFGGLCAEEWFLLVEMHYRHHLLQWDRLKQGLVQGAR
ncbi:DinB family protein [Paenibacillus sp. MMS20-IR301]|uniref:DinB family protein n=1 Tax=Paenibacillus sp. MMS20-IR301 TaxID=2895946 RepID=UPI0028E6C303|nr:DinB family protein [Paenibacillus sp. MMS20-IR301]WNS47049.1 DinB family protein [Paenibacillus sp. MMS20-IR301]